MNQKELSLETKLLYLKSTLSEFKFISSLEVAQTLARERQISSNMLQGIVSLAEAYGDCNPFKGVMGDLVNYAVSKMIDDLDLLLFRSEITTKKREIKS